MEENNEMMNEATEVAQEEVKQVETPETCSMEAEKPECDKKKKCHLAHLI